MADESNPFTKGEADAMFGLLMPMLHVGSVVSNPSTENISRTAIHALPNNMFSPAHDVVNVVFSKDNLDLLENVTRVASMNLLTNNSGNTSVLNASTALSGVSKLARSTQILKSDPLLSSVMKGEIPKQDLGLSDIMDAASSLRHSQFFASMGAMDIGSSALMTLPAPLSIPLLSNLTKSR